MYIVFISFSSVFYGLFDIIIVRLAISREEYKKNAVYRKAVEISKYKVTRKFYKILPCAFTNYQYWAPNFGTVRKGVGVAPFSKKKKRLVAVNIW